MQLLHSLSPSIPISQLLVLTNFKDNPFTVFQLISYNHVSDYLILNNLIKTKVNSKNI